MRYLVQLCLAQRHVVAVATAALLAVGAWLSTRYPLDVFPEFAPPLVEVQTEAPGMSSEAVENLVTIPLESAVNGIPRMTTLRSKSVQGLSSVVMFFERDANLVEVRQMVGERVGVVKLPAQVQAPRLMPPLSSTSRVLHIGLTPKRAGDLAPGEPALTQTDVSALLRWTIQPRLLRVPGVANISTYGQHDKEYHVLVDPEQLRAHGVTLRQVSQALRASVGYGSAGFHDTPNQRLAIQFRTRIDDPQDLARIVVDQRAGAPLLLGQIATFQVGNPPFIGEGVINDEAGLFVVVEKYPWANTLQVTRDVEAALEALRPGLPGVQINLDIFRPATFIEIALVNLRFAMILGCGLVALILVAFLCDWRTAVISLTAIPLSIVAALVILGQWGFTINTMVLAGLAIAIGEVVDDAIIDVENIVRRLKLNRAAAQPRPAFRVVLDASLEVRSAVVYASFIVVFVCLPIFFLGGVAGSFFRPLALAYILAVLASLAVALVVTPALCLMLLPQAAQPADAPLTRWLRAGYRRALPVFLGRPALTYAGLALLLAATGVCFVRLKEAFLPQFQETDFLMHWVAKPGTGLDVMTRDIRKVGKEMLDEQAVVGFGSHIARAEMGEEVYGANFSELWVSLGRDFRGDYPAARHKIEAIMARHPGFEHDLLTYLQERIKEVLSGAGASVVLRIYGPDLDGLRRRAAEVRDAIAGVPGVSDLKVEAQVLVPQLQLVIDPYRSAAHGLRPQDVAAGLATFVHGEIVGEVHQEQLQFDIRLRGRPEAAGTLHDLRRLLIDLPLRQGHVPLRAVADLQVVSAPNTIRHDKASRCIDVTCNVKDRDLGGVVADLQQRIRALPERAGYRLEFLGEHQARQENQRQLLGFGLLSLLGIALLLFIDFQSLRLTILVLATLPFALIGGVFAAYASGGVLSLGSLVGFVTVLGIAARNGIMLVSHYRHLQSAEGLPFGRALVIRGATERVAPILMTALAAGLGLLPLALFGNQPGYEVEHPMALVILGGLTTSTLLNLVVLPVLYAQFGGVGTAAPDAAGQSSS